MLTLVVLSFALAPLGCFLVWKRLTFFSDGLSHACTFGIALALFLKIHFLVGILLTALAIAFILFFSEKYQYVSIDIFFSLLSSTFFAGGVIALSLIKGAHISIDDILFGDFLAIQREDFFVALSLSLIALVVLFVYWRDLLLSCISPDLAKVNSARAKNGDVIFILITACLIAFGMYLVGALLLPALIILPVACARVLSVSPQQMMVYSIVLSILSCCLGITLSSILDIPTSATMVFSSSFIFVVLCVLKKRMINA